VAQLNFALLCGRSIVDQATKLLSLVDIIETITFNRPQGVPDDGSVAMVSPLNMDLVIELSRSHPDTPETTFVRLEIQDPRGTLIGGSELTFDLQTAIKFRGFIKLAGLPFSVAGNYTLDIQSRERNEGEWLSIRKLDLPVVILPSPQSS
jgi:hypothetical protein